MSLRHALLGALADRPRTGYGLLKHFEQSLAYAWPASHSQIYPELARLLGEGLIEETERGARGSKTYALTSLGVEEIRRWLRETEPERRVRSDAALRTFFLWLLEPGEAREHLERERAHAGAVLEELRTIESQPAGTSRKERAFRIALDGGIRTLETRIAWLDDVLEEVSSSEWEEAPAEPHVPRATAYGDENRGASARLVRTRNWKADEGRMNAICSHLDRIEVTELPDEIAGCQECLAMGATWVHLRMCETCGHIGCCDQSPNRHARRHWRATSHPIMRSAEPGEAWSWCFVDEVTFFVDEE